MALTDRKIPIIPTTSDRVGNDIPSVEGQANHPNASLLCKNYNDLIDNELTALNTAIATIPTTATIRSSITVQGNATYDNETGVITVSNADFAVDHISLTNTNGRFKTYTIWADSAETVQLGQFTVTDGLNGIDGTNGTNGVDGVDGQDGRPIEKVTSADNGDGTKTITFWGDLAETINLGNVILASGIDGADGADGRSITNTSYNASTGILTLTFSDATTFDTGDLRGANGTNGTNGADGVSPTVTVLTQSAYTALGTYDSNTFYVING